MKERLGQIELGPCPKCRKKAGELKKAETPSRFPWRVQCGACGWMTASVKLPSIAEKLWNESRKQR